MAAPGRQARQVATASNSSMILDGRYSTGTNTQLRKTRDADLFLRFPQLQELVLGHLASATFHHCRTLTDDDTLEDGFVARFGEELLSIDSRTDPALQRFLGNVRDQIKAQTGTKDKVALASKLIAEACGGTDAESRWSKHFEALHTEPPDVLLIGALLGTAGLCRHRALLLKYILDKLAVCPSAVLDGVVVANGEVDIASLRGRGIAVNHMWNFVVLDQPFLCDLMHMPGELRSIDDLQRLNVCYHRPGGRTGMLSLGDVEKAMLLDGRSAVETTSLPDVGSAVGVFSKTLGHWLPGHVTGHGLDGSVTVEFSVDGTRLRKHLEIGSPQIRMAGDYYEAVPCCTLRDSSEACGMMEKRIGIQLSGQPWQDVGALRLQHHQNNSFYCETMMTTTCEVRYTGPKEDVLVKVYTVRADQQACFDTWEKYTMCGYVHGYRPEDTVLVKGGCSYFLGFVVHKDINEKWFWTLTQEESEVNERRSTEGGWQGRGEVEAKCNAKEADYILSRATKETEQNNKRLRRLTQRPVPGPHGDRPITFCTDRSLGMGQHFETDAAKASLYQHFETDAAKASMYLGKHGFGMPILTGLWFEDYVQAADRTVHGMLVVSYSDDYFSSAACRKEINGLEYSQVHVYVEDLDRIVTFKEFQEHQKHIAPPLVKASCQGDLEQVYAILQQRLDALRDLDANRSTALMGAAGWGHVDVAKVLLDAHAEIDAQDHFGKTALIHSVIWANVEVAELLLQHRASSDSDTFEGFQAIHFAASKENILTPSKLPVMKLLLEARVDSNSRSTVAFHFESKGTVPLHLAAYYGQKDAVQLLLEHDADPLGQDDKGNTVLDYAKKGREDQAPAGSEGMIEFCQSLLEQ
mmetsp:Transcript_50054/g.160900  ORF Transcript_50054/g.160900 Transcript_50054/m.160900 type:complete len:863 (+) Transcript_50054:140-2728(+)